VLFAGLLNHWGGKGPAEIPAKRLQTYRYTYWQAGEYGITMRYPPAHPFNSIHALRLAIALDCGYEAVRTVFEFIWKDGRSVTDDWPALIKRLGLTVAAADALIAEQSVKDALAANGREAIARGVYGVPTFDSGKELFWGLDATDMLLDYLEDPGVFDDAEMQRIAGLPVGAARKF
jgi:2-hydroxychromene-2-carboxylate isomerase